MHVGNLPHPLAGALALQFFRIFDKLPKLHPFVRGLAFESVGIFNKLLKIHPFVGVRALEDVGIDSTPKTSVAVSFLLFREASPLCVHLSKGHVIVERSPPSANLSMQSSWGSKGEGGGR